MKKNLLEEFALPLFWLLIFIVSSKDDNAQKKRPQKKVEKNANASSANIRSEYSIFTEALILTRN